MKVLWKFNINQTISSLYLEFLKLGLFPPPPPTLLGLFFIRSYPYTTYLPILVKSTKSIENCEFNMISKAVGLNTNLDHDFYPHIDLGRTIFNGMGAHVHFELGRGGGKRLMVLGGRNLDWFYFKTVHGVVY